MCLRLGRFRGQARGRRRFRVTTDSRGATHVVGNRLARHFDVPQPNTVWAADLTACWTGEGWIYLAVALDLASRRVVGWAVRATVETELVLAALHLAVSARRIAQACCIIPIVGCSTRAGAIDRRSPGTGSWRA